MNTGVRRPGLRTVVRTVCGALLVAVAAVAWPLAASAHGGGAVFDGVVVDQEPPGQVVLSLDITYEDDGEPAEAAIVDVVAHGPAGQVADGVRLERVGEPGSYRGDLDLAGPGMWRLEVSSSFPPGATEVPVEVEAAVADLGGTDDGGSTLVNVVVGIVFGLIGAAAGLWVSKRRNARRRADEGR